MAANYTELNARVASRRDTDANWLSADPILLDGEIVVVDTDSGEVRKKIGDGTSHYSELDFDDEVMKDLVNSKQSILTGTAGQVVGFDEDGNAVAQDAADASEPDMAENDETAAGFIKNRTHWKEMTESEVLEESVYTSSGGYAALNYVLPLEVGATYSVTFEGEKYELVAFTATAEGTEWVVIGNASIYGVGDNTGEPFMIGAAPAYSMSVIVPAAGDGSYTVGICSVSSNYHTLDNGYLDFLAEEDARDLMMQMGLMDRVYGVEWYYGDSALTRTHAALGLPNPVPAEDLTSTGSSPFDEIMPWAGMKRYNIIDGAISYSEDDDGFSATDYDTVVYIPEFWYRTEKDETVQRWRWIISPEERDGYVKHPGSGRYVGRYHTTGTVADGVTCKSGLKPLVSTTRDGFRQASHTKGDNWWMMDLATWNAIQLLFLVEYADFNSQGVLGEGQVSGSVIAGGGTDGAVYHSVKRTGASNQYRWIEDPWSNVFDFIDGITWSDFTAYVSTDNASYADTVGNMTNTGVSVNAVSDGYFWAFPAGFSFSEEAPWAFLPGAADETTPTAGDYASVGPGVRVVYVGGYYYSNPSCGLFYFYADYNAAYYNSSVGARLLYIP